MSPLTLAPIPSPRSDNQSQSRFIEEEGFVDESVVRAVMLIQSAPFRRQSDPADLALAADDLDFAGWHAPRQIPVAVPPLPVLPEHNAAPQSAKAKPVAFKLPPATQVSRRKAPVPMKSHSWIPICAGIFMLALSSILVAILATERDFSFQSIMKEIFDLPAAAEKFEKATATQAQQSTPKD